MPSTIPLSFSAMLSAAAFSLPASATALFQFGNLNNFSAISREISCSGSEVRFLLYRLGGFYGCWRCFRSWSRHGFCVGCWFGWPAEPVSLAQAPAVIFLDRFLQTLVARRG